jgi:DNA-directed RNA polymerase subunit RPC12/RpoP
MAVMKQVLTGLTRFVRTASFPCCCAACGTKMTEVDKETAMKNHTNVALFNRNGMEFQDPRYYKCPKCGQAAVDEGYRRLAYN